MLEEWGFSVPFIAGAWGSLCRQRLPKPPKAVQGGTGEDVLRVSSPSSPLENPPFKSKKLKLFLLGKKTVGFLSQPLLPKGEDSLRE